MVSTSICKLLSTRAVGGVRKRQSGSPNTAADCNFAKGIKAEMCLWDNLGNSTDLHWEASIGQDAFWKGGPRVDKTDGSLDGGDFVSDFLLQLNMPSILPSLTTFLLIFDFHSQ